MDTKIQLTDKIKLILAAGVVSAVFVGGPILGGLLAVEVNKPHRKKQEKLKLERAFIAYNNMLNGKIRNYSAPAATAIEERANKYIKLSQ